MMAILLCKIAILECVKYTEKHTIVLKVRIYNMFYQYLYFFVYSRSKVQNVSRVTKLTNALFHNKIHLKKGYFVKEIDLPEVLSQRKSPF
jgi:hypothetical protein